jgi:surface carbohydrate biosynthesis protein
MLKYNLLKNITKINIQKKETVDVLIIDFFGYEVINECLPNSATHKVIELTKSIPVYVSFNFLINIFIILVTRSIKSVALYELYTKLLMPKVVITFNDNNLYFGKLAKIFPKLLFISIQNGTRYMRSFGDLVEKPSVPIYYGFGEYEKKLLTENQVQIQKYVNAGSIKMGILLSQQNKINSKKYDICFVSYFRIKNNKKPNNLSQSLMDVNKQLFDIIANICFEKKYSLCVVMFSEKGNSVSRADSDYNLELEYYQKDNVDQNIDYVSNKFLEMGSYKTAMESRCVIGLCSTLLFEVFGTKIRTLFGNMLFKPFYEDDRILLKSMSVENILYEMDKKHIQSKIETLMNMPDEEYINKTKFARYYYMRCERPYPHEMIKKNITEHLNIPVEQ